MEQSKDNFLCTYKGLLDNPEIIILKGKKLPSLNEYAENYLANLNNDKYSKNLNNNNKLDDCNDKNHSVKEKSIKNSNNNSFIVNNLNNQILNSNENGNIKSLKEDSIIENKEIKNNLNNENPQNNNKKESDSSKGVNKEKDTNIKINNDINYLSRINLDEYYNQNKMILSEIYKKISPLNTRLNSPLFSSFKTSETNYSRNVKLFENNQNNKLNFSKSLISLNNSRNNKNSSFFSRKKSIANNLKINSSQSLTNVLTSYLSNRDQFFKVKNKKINFKKKNNDFLLKFSDYTSNDESLTPYCVTNRVNTSKSHSQSVKDYWKEKEIKKQIKIEKIKKERRLKESKELRDRPKINPNSRKIANKISNHSSLNVFDRLFELKKQFIFNERRFNTKTENNNKNGKITKNIIKEKNYQNYLMRNKNGFDINNKYRSLKQIENINKILIEKNKKEQKNNSSMPNNTNLHKINSLRQGHNFKIENKEGSISNIKTLMKRQKNLNESHNRDIKLTSYNNANSKKDIFLPKIMYKRNKTKKNLLKKEELTKIINNENKSLNSKFINNDNILIDYNFKGNNNENVNEKKNQKINPIRIQIRNFNDTKSYKSSKNIKGLSFLNPNYIDLNTYDNYGNNIYENDMITQNFEYNNYFNRNGYDLIDNNHKLNTEIFYNGKTYNTKTKKLDEKIDKMFMTKSCKNKRVESIKNLSNNNKNMINTKKYFVLPKKTDINKNKCQQVIFNKEYLNKINNFNFNDKIEKDIIDLDKCINTTNGITYNELNNEEKENYKKNANIPYDKNRNHNIKRRKLDLLKILNFSSSIGIDYITHN